MISDTETERWCVCDDPLPEWWPNEEVAVEAVCKRCGREL